MQSSDFLEYLVLQQAAGGGAAGAVVWLQVALLVCLFLVAILRPGVVRSKSLFRLAGVLFALSLLISPTLNFLLGYLYRLSGPGPSYGRMSGEMATLLSFPSVVSAVLLIHGPPAISGAALPRGRSPADAAGATRSHVTITASHSGVGLSGEELMARYFFSMAP